MKKVISSRMLNSVLISSVLASLLFVADAFAQSAPTASNAQQPSFMEAMMRMFPLCIIIYFIFYFLVTRPQEQANKKKKEMLDKLMMGDKVLTSCGIYGRVVSSDQESVVLDIAQGVKVKFTKNSIVEII